MGFASFPEIYPRKKKKKKKQVNMPHLFWAEVKLLRFKMALKWFYETTATGNLSLALSDIEL